MDGMFRPCCAVLIQLPRPCLGVDHHQTVAFVRKLLQGKFGQLSGSPARLTHLIADAHPIQQRRGQSRINQPVILRKDKLAFVRAAQLMQYRLRGGAKHGSASSLISKKLDSIAEQMRTLDRQALDFIENQHRLG